VKEREKQEYLEEYAEEKRKGVDFFPDIIFKDSVVMLILFLILFGLSAFVGPGLEEVADPTDTSYTPKPEWYFLFLFQLLKFFPGSIEVIGVIVLPVLAIGFLAALPWTDTSKNRHWTARPVVTGITAALLAGGIWLTAQAQLETPPPSGEVVTATGDPVAELYSFNCAGCHGTSLTVSPGTDLFRVISGGTHEGMPAFASDLTVEEIDSLAGFLVAPRGNEVFARACGDCHVVSALVEEPPEELVDVLALGVGYAAHSDQDLPDWAVLISPEEETELLNFLSAPDGQRLWAQECASCHGSAVAFTGDEDELRRIVAGGGLHLEMPAFREDLTENDIAILADFVSGGEARPEAARLWTAHCFNCHGGSTPQVSSSEEALAAITSGGAHETMPVWGDVLTDEQIDALVEYVFDLASGRGASGGAELYATNCASCHGDLGEGGPNPTRAGDIIAPISTAEYLGTRDDRTLRAIIAQGQPNFGMSPFGTAFGGPLDDAQVDGIIAFMRVWETDPPVELPPEIPDVPAASASGAEIFAQLCSQCHGEGGEGGIGPNLVSDEYQQSQTDEDIFDAINLGHAATSMIAWGEILSAAQIADLVAAVRNLASPEPVGTPTFEADVLPIFEQSCNVCHGTAGGWTGTSYADTLLTGDPSPTIIPGDPDNSRLLQSLIGTHPDGVVMPPSGSLTQAEINIISAWIVGGAPER
jgi:mono/diheme cytochrome c family protein